MPSRDGPSSVVRHGQLVQKITTCLCSSATSASQHISPGDFEQPIPCLFASPSCKHCRTRSAIPALIPPSRFLLRTAARTFSAAPSRALLSKSRPITTIAPLASRSRQQQWSITSFQRRFASDDAAKGEAAAVPDNFAQTAAEAPVEDNLTPAQREAQAEPTNASATVGADALAAAAGSTPETRASRGPRAPPTPNNVLYIGNLYYEVTTEQLQRVFSRFGDIESVKIIYDNRGLSRGCVTAALDPVAYTD